jgi:hypothetical protein
MQYHGWFDIMLFLTEETIGRSGAFRSPDVSPETFEKRPYFVEFEAKFKGLPWPRTQDDRP